MKRTTTKITVLAALLCIFSISLNAQTFTWGQATPSLDENGSVPTHLLATKFYKIYSKYNSDIFNQDVKVTPFALSNMAPGTTADLGVEQPVMGKAMMTHLKMFPTTGSNAVIFLDEYNTKTKQRELFTQTVNLENSERSKISAAVTAMPGRNTNYYVVQSPNKQFYAVLKHHSYDKKLNEKVNVALLDKDLKMVKEISFETPYMNKTPLEQDFYVGNNGSVYVVKSIDLAKMKPFKTVFFWDGKSDTMKETSLKFDNDFQIYAYQGNFDGDDFYLHGLYTRIGSKGVQMYGGSLPAAGVYAAKFNAAGDNVYKQTNDTGEIPGLHLKDFVMDGMKTWMFADKVFVFDKYKKTAAGTPSFEKDYTYKNDAIVFGKLDNETGKLEWHKILPYEEESTLNDNGTFLSYLYFLKNNQLTILYNDTQKTKIADRLVNDRFTAIEVYDGMGNQVSKSFVADTGLEPKFNYSYNGFEENFDLDTSIVPVKVSEGKYIVRAKSGSNEKYGYITF